VFSPEPWWLDEAYSDAISNTDVGLLHRCRTLSSVSATLIRLEGLRHGTFLDWAGGYGTLTRMMRDKGYAFWHEDPYATNLFAKDFEAEASMRFDLATAFEVVEHLTDPITALAPLAERTDRIFFTTRLLPDPAPQPSEWWYYALDTGQHVTFHTRRSLEKVGERLGFSLLTNGENYHLFHRTPPRVATRIMLTPAFPRARSAAAARLGRVRDRNAAPQDHLAG
jgi:hypothetical protein